LHYISLQSNVPKLLHATWEAAIASRATSLPHSSLM
jgi:hypothetical protein